MPSSDTSPDAFPQDLLDLQVASLRAQAVLSALPDWASAEERDAARAAAAQAAVELFDHPGKVASQADGRWNDLVQAAREVLAAETVSPAP